MYRSPFTAQARTCGSPFKQKGTMWSCGYHTGEDWYCENKTIVSPATGTVQRNRLDKSYGNYIIIAADDGKVILMAHMETRAVPAEGARIQAGDTVGIMGTTGNSTGVHLHIEVEGSATWTYNKNLLKPSDYVDFGNYTAVEPAPAPSGSYQVGDHVTFSTCYASSTAGTGEVIPVANMAVNHGTITRVVSGAANPYLLDGGLCWVNDGDIRGYYNQNRTGTVMTDNKPLNLRNAPDGAVIGSIPRGAAVQITGEVGDWYKVSYDGMNGYASKQYLLS